MSLTYAMPDLDGNGRPDTVTMPDKSKLYDPGGNRLDYAQVFGEPEVQRKDDPFEESALDAIPEFLHKHGPVIGKLFLILGSASATAYNSWKASHMEGVAVWWLVFSILGFCGLIVEGGFAYGWGVRGKQRLAGEQVKTADKIFKRSAYTMMGDLSLSVGEIAFGIHGIAQFWIGILQPFVAVHIIMLYYKLKGEDPEAMAKQEIVTLRAQAKADEVSDKAQAWKHELADRKNHRQIEAREMQRRHAYLLKVVNSWWYGRRMRREVNQYVGKYLLGTGLKDKLKELPQSLNLNKPLSN